MARLRNSLSDSLELVTVQHHEGSTILSCTSTSGESLEVIRPKITSLIQMIQLEVESQDGLVGHIKAYVTDSGAADAFSGTGDTVYTSHIREHITQIHFTAIIFGCDEKPILAQIENTLYSI
jgi:hypothetical protein